MSESSEKTPIRGPFPGIGRTRANPKSRSSLGTLVTDVPKLLTKLVRDEVEQGKRELISTGTKYGIAVGLFAAAAFFALTLWAVLVTAAVLGLNTVFAPWLSALIVAGAFLLLVIVLGLAGYLALKRAGKLAPERTIASVKQDVNAVKGLGQYE
ncbi:phage holin family protein [Pseudoclavibacter sp. RFBJ3]|uniref:phage holin family protein n=1 Tax=unclassified Pseudoclavibacter TaxID=2615177 RepID=UPI000CE8AC74|nr:MULTISPECIES: phage holin family protein [unclassified Pseudoclavibacter]MBF4551238.1 phage holin family protein [Pseudoclavibacter sp. VKM Ac-2888]PPF35984.1 phage holin family protein [Pseudoclavibacter sp. AY1H1]PPF73591.1 phage holin family protein [Pseudoclavibacter sp. Z016]PPF81628.1 phage holin family protein [Pseudoclavibacter sp. RFBJ5]PPF90958.1 phage holin family protein [Pseudoclavibacter sp. RFBJ3]